MWAFAFFLVEATFNGVPSFARNLFPYPTPKGHVRIVAWNIEFLGNRNPPRTPEQRLAIAERIRTFDAAVLALQEILRPGVLDQIRTALGPSWKTHASWWQNNALLYNSDKVKMLSVEYLKYTEKDKGSPKIKWPGPWYRRPISGVFRALEDNGKSFQVIGVHCHWKNRKVRGAEGEWLGFLVKMLLRDSNKTHDIVLLGDFNGEPGRAPHPALQEGSLLHILLKENGNTTNVSGRSIDHIYLSQPLMAKLKKKLCFVIRPGYYMDTIEQFEAIYSDHFPLFVDIAR